MRNGLAKDEPIATMGKSDWSKTIHIYFIVSLAAFVLEQTLVWIYIFWFLRFVLYVA